MRPARPDQFSASRDRTVAGSTSLPDSNVGPVAEHGALRVVKFWIGRDEFAIVSLPGDEPPPCGSEHQPSDLPRSRNLTATERAVAELAVSGLSNRAIAERRRTSPSTIANQLAGIYKKLGLSSRAEL